jgi:hypothetical protein
MPDILVKSFCEWVRRDLVPEELSREYVDDGHGGEKMVIRFKRDKGGFFDFPYSEVRYNQIWELVNDYWQCRNQASIKHPYISKWHVFMQ